MMNLIHSDRRRVLAVMLAFAAGSHARAANWPTRSVTVVVPYPTGGLIDSVARAVSQKLAEQWGQAVVVQNRVGANGAIGSSFVAKAEPDGHTLLMVVGTHAINPVLIKGLPFDTAKAFSPITRMTVSPVVVVASTSGPFKTLKDMVDTARRTEVPLAYSEGQTRLTGELIRQSGNLKLVPVSYKGGAQMVIDVLGGHVPMGMTSALTAVPHVQAGKLRVLGVAANQRMAIFPDSMTFGEVGLQGVESLSWTGVLGPAGIPAATVSQLHGDIQKTMSSPEMMKQMRDNGQQIDLMPPEEFGRFISAETAKWLQVANRGGIQAE